jgi:hypothetical protein
MVASSGQSGNPVECRAVSRGNMHGVVVVNLFGHVIEEANARSDDSIDEETIG